MYSYMSVGCAERQRFRFLQKVTHKQRKPNAHAGFLWVMENDPQTETYMKLTNLKTMTHMTHKLWPRDQRLKMHNPHDPHDPQSAG